MVNSVIFTSRLVIGPARGPSAVNPRAFPCAALALVGVLLLSWGISAGPCSDTHYGDLVLQGNDELVIDGTTYCQTGNIYVSDNARLVITSGTLVFNQRYHGEYRLYFSGSAGFQVTDGSIESPYAYGLVFSDSSAGLIDDSPIGGAQFVLAGTSSLSIIRSDALNISVSGSARLQVVSSEINEVALNAEGSVRAEIANVRPGYFPHWDLRADNATENWGINITLEDSRVGAWNVSASGSSALTFDNCNLGLGLRENAYVAARNSDLWYVSLTFGPGQTIVLRDLRRGVVTHWDIEHGVQGNAGGVRLAIDNCELESYWNIFNTGADLTVVGCELGYLWLAGAIGPVTIVESSTIDSLVFSGHYGTVRFSSTVVSWRFFPPSNGATRIEGGVKFLMDHLNFEEGEWHNATIVREFPVSVLDASGLPLVGVALQLLSQSGEVVWSGETDAEGRADFEIAFGDTNYQDTWTLAVPSTEATRAVALLTGSPIAPFTSRRFPAI